MTVETNYAIATLIDRLKISRQFFNQREAKRIAPCTCDFLHAFFVFITITVKKNNVKYYTTIPRRGGE